MITYFISGHRDITPAEFSRSYSQMILSVQPSAGEEATFVVGECAGVDSMAQDFIHALNNPGIHVVVYHMFTKPRYNPYNYPTAGGYQNDYDRDCAMTMASDEDILWVRPGKENSGTAQNKVRREMFNCFKTLRKKDRLAILQSWGKMYGIELQEICIFR